MDMVCNGQIWTNKKCGKTSFCMFLVHCIGGGCDSPYFMICMALFDKTCLITASTFIRASGVLDEKLLGQMVCGNAVWTWPECSAKADSNCRCGPTLRFPGSRKGQNFNHAYSLCSFFLAISH